MILKKIKEKLPANTIVLLYFIFGPLVRYSKVRKINNVRKKQADIIKRIKDKETISAIFLVMHESVWKYEFVYQILKKNKKFNPVVVVIPHVENEKVELDVYNKTLKYFEKNGYNVKGTLDEINNKWVEIDSFMNSDIVFFTNPHKITFDKYYVNNFKNQLTCYVPYSFQVSNLYEMQFNQPFHSMVWKQFYETTIHEEIGKQYSITNGANIVVTGYPGIDAFLQKEILLNNPWPIKNSVIKNIIWAPHHTIDGFESGLGYSTFLNYAIPILDFVKSNSKNYQFAFKPHPLLKGKLYKHSSWGIEKTNAYYKEWGVLENGFFHDSNYLGLFKYSDAMIHDSGSFTAEYLVMNKPVLFLFSTSSVKHNFNKFGKICLNKHYHGYVWKDLVSFLEEVVLEGSDYMENERRMFVEGYCMPPNFVSASENIVNMLLSVLEE